MRRVLKSLITTVIAVSLAILAACTTASPTKNDGNANVGSTQANMSKNASSKKQDPTRGSIEVTSVPPGAKVLLVPTDETGAGEPQSKGLTPTTIDGLEPGKYTVDLEKPGYKFFQKEVVVKAGAVAKVSATLKKH